MGYPSRRVTLDGLLLGAAVCVNVLEGLFPYPLPGVKLGLPNALGLAAFALWGFKDAALVSLGRVLLSGLLFSGFGLSFLCSLAGVLGALGVLGVMGRMWPERLSLRGLAQAQALAFNLAQLWVASRAVSSFHLFLSYLPIMGISSILTGFATGTMAEWLCQKIKGTEVPPPSP
ncbi:putative membrane protein [Thermanaerovibrio velox DSM 12556]|uniref:Putative membrane protein n=1 Tax=Thermanaerovibrio velox DSM 12556 TaxID=926567 RepID=H0UPD3_9BACT|nr:Gx transporter family protein [Thermanaerovibrio velox]EHM10564.1 putative membrane protein [Thermanaerovibrio velox DSM 12556]